MGSVSTLFTTSLKGWLGAKGFWVVVLAALVPLGLTGAWVATHRADVVATDLTWSPTNPVEGQNVTFTALVKNIGGVTVRDFNTSLVVGRVSQDQLIPSGPPESLHVDSLAPGESKTLTLNWTATPGIYFALADADPEAKLAEIDTYNDQSALPLAVAYATPTDAQAPLAPPNITGNASAPRAADLAVDNVTWAPDPPASGTNTHVTATFTNLGPNDAPNATLVLRVGRVFNGQLVASQEQRLPLNFTVGVSSPVTVTWPAAEGVSWVEAYADAGPNAHDPNAANNHVAKPITIQPVVTPDMKPPTPPPKLTIKQFYIQVLSLLHLRVLLPFVALFYAGGILADEESRGTLTYLLTRPIGRWTIPLVKFVAGYLVAALAVTAGLVATFALLFGTPGSDIGFLTTPILFSLLALLVYGAFFTLLGVLVPRPYLIGVAFVLGWENVAGAFLPWVENLTIAHHLANAINAWPLDQGVQWLPGGDSIVALRYLVLAALVALGAAAYAMKRKEFET
ncbi:MAG: CARDB domain-containing protein [Thermoplasmatota archaeon]